MRLSDRSPIRAAPSPAHRRGTQGCHGPRRLAAFLATTLALSACTGPGADESKLTDGDSAVAAAAEAPPRALDYEVTSDRYRRWLVAQRALDTLDAIALPSPMHLRNAGAEEMARVEGALASEPRARAAIEASGLRVEDYVKTSVALEQAMAGIPGDRGGAIAFRDIPAANAAMLASADSAFRRTWDTRRFRVVDAPPSAGRDDSDSDSYADSDRGGRGGKNGHAKKGKGNGRGRGHGKH